MCILYICIDYCNKIIIILCRDRTGNPLDCQRITRTHVTRSYTIMLYDIIIVVGIMYDSVAALEENANSFETVCYIIIIIIICIIIAFGPTAVGLNGLCRLGVASEQLISLRRCQCQSSGRNFRDFLTVLIL